MEVQIGPWARAAGRELREVTAHQSIRNRVLSAIALLDHMECSFNETPEPLEHALELPREEDSKVQALNKLQIILHLFSRRNLEIMGVLPLLFDCLLKFSRVSSSYISISIPAVFGVFIESLDT